MVTFYVIVYSGSSSISRYLSQIDSSYASIFGNESWLQLCETASSQDLIQAKAEIQEITNRIQGYLQTAGPCTQIPVIQANFFYFLFFDKCNAYHYRLMIMIRIE